MLNFILAVLAIIIGVYLIGLLLSGAVGFIIWFAGDNTTLAVAIIAKCLILAGAAGWEITRTR